MPRRKSKKDIPEKIRAKDYVPRSIKSKQKTKVKRGRRGQRLTKKDIYKPINEPQFESRRLIQDEQDRKRAKKIDEGAIVYEKMLSMIDDNIKSGSGWGGKYLINELNKQMDTYGFEEEMMMLASAPRDAILIAETISKTSDGNEVENQIIHLRDLIEGAYADLQTSMELEEEMEKDDYIEKNNEAGETEYPQQNNNNLPYNNG